MDVIIEDNPDLKWALESLTERLGAYGLYDAYYDGNHRLAFATEKFESAFGKKFKELADNLCPKVVDVVADRLRITGFSLDVPEGTPVSDAEKASVEGQVWALWKAARMARWAGVAHTGALKLGDAYIIVWPDKLNPRLPRFYVNDASRVIVRYDEELPGTVSFAMKWWHLTDMRIRINLYYPNQLVRLVSIGKLVEGLPKDVNKFQLYSEDKLNPILPNPLGVVPVFHLANGVGPGRAGRSELRDAIPLQDALNKAVADMLVAMEFVGLPQRWATGVETEVDPITGKDRAQAFDVAVNRLLSVEDENAHFGEFSAANLMQFLEVQEKFRVEIARVTSTPIHHINQSSNDAPSGEALKTAEAPLTSKVEDRQEAFGEVWGDVLGLAYRIAQGRAPSGTLSPIWKDTEPRNTQAFWQVLTLKDGLGVPRRQLYIEGGYTPTQADDFVSEASVAPADIGAALLGAFDTQQQRPITPSTPAVGTMPMQLVKSNA